ncbi:MAG: hypothetical protein KatS3mg023_2022 [Armatimonadota bacterium]|nr:MAG: hypothetical protein KatS3mg023_2022 [Armatimonadota bacterium]
MSCCAVARGEFHKGSFIDTPMRSMLQALLICLLMGAVTAQQTPPQVTIVVVSTGTGEDRLTFAYNTVVPEKEARERFERLLRYGGWQGKLLKVRTESPRSIAGTPLPPMTDVIGRARNVIDRNSGGLPVEPFLRAFSDLDAFEIYFLVQGEMPFQGLREWTTRDLQVKLIYTPGVYRYQVRIWRHAADVDLRVPFHQPVEQRQPAQEPRKETALMWRIAGWALVSLALGALAYLVMRWAMRHSSRLPASAQRHESTREG